MLAVSTFFPRISTNVVGCPEPTMALAVVDACIAFCEDSLFVRQYQADQTCTIGVAAYTLPSTAYETPARVLTVKVAGRVIYPAPLEAGALAEATSNGTPQFYYTTRVDSALKLNLYPAPDSAYALSVEVALKPLRTATQVQDDLFNIWSDVICAGAVGRIQSIAGQMYSNPPAAATNMMLAAAGAKKARIESTVGRVIATRKVAYNPIA